MKIDAGFHGGDLRGAIRRVQRLEALGVDGVVTSETSYDPFLSALIGAEHTSSPEIMTGIVVAFARNPMTTALAAHDLQRYSRGRFVLGLGSQIKPHIEKRYSMPWSHPAPRMREFIAALSAIWRSWNEGEPLAFRGEFYTHTLMTPFFSPAPSDAGPPKIYLAAVGDLMSQVAGEVADGLLTHPFTTVDYLRDSTLAAVGRGLSIVGRARDSFAMAGSVFVVSGADEQALRDADRLTRKQIAFYGSTPAYRPVLEHHGWGELQDELNRLSKRGEWDAMGELVTDEMLEHFAVVCNPDDVGPQLRRRYGELLDRVQLNTPYPLSDQLEERMLASFS